MYIIQGKSLYIKMKKVLAIIIIYLIFFSSSAIAGKKFKSKDIKGFKKVNISSSQIRNI